MPSFSVSDFEEDAKWTAEDFKKEEDNKKLAEAESALTELGSVLEQRRREQGGTLTASEPGFLSRVRTSDFGRKLFGPTREEREAMVAQQPGLLEIPQTMLKFTTAPPQITEPIREVTEPVISRLSPVPAGIARGVRDVAVGALGSLPAGALMAPRLVAAPFAADYASTLPEQFQAIREAETPGEAAQALTATGLGGALTIAGTVEALRPQRRIAVEPQERPIVLEPERIQDASKIQEATPLDGPLREQAIEVAQEVPTQADSQGVPASTGQAATVPPKTAVFNGIQMAGPSFKYFNEKTGRWNDVSAETAKQRGLEIPPEELAKAEAAQKGTSETTQTEGSVEVKPGMGEAGQAGQEAGVGTQVPVRRSDVPEIGATQAAGSKLYAGIPDPVATARSVSELTKSAGELASPHLRRAGQYLADATREALTLPKTSDYRRSVLDWSSKLQRSFDEASQRQKSIMKAAPDEVARQGITNWIQAGGDMNVLAERLSATADPKLKAGYQAALSMTPEQQALAGEIKATFDSLAERGQGAEVLNNFRDNYVTQIWDLDKGPSVGSSRNLKKNFRYAKARVFNSYFEGEQAGFSPKTKDIAKILPLYLHEMNSVIAARELAADIGKGKASDGKPLAIARGELGPKTSEYRMLPNQPAFNNVALHPEAFNKIKAVVGRSAIREWYSTPTGALPAIPKAIVKGLDLAQSETKRTMLGLFAPFHQVQEGTHAVGHRISPFDSPKIDLVNNELQIDATKHGLMLAPDRASEANFMEGFRTSGLISKIPGIGPLADSYSTYLFHQYIPGLKFKTYEAILRRNNEVYAKELQDGSVAPEDVKILSGEQANAAYGHLNYADLGRNPTVQHLLQLGLLAPDFLEARGRFAFQAAKGATGAKVGREQLVALGFLAASQAIAAYTGAQLSGGEWDARHPFEFHVGSRKYTMRSVPEDVDALISHTRSFVHGRLSPVIGKGAVQYLSGVNWRGQKVTPLETTKELAVQPIPLTARSIPGLRHLTGSDRPGAVSPLEQLAGSLGFKISRYYPNEKLAQLHNDWMKDNPDPKIQKDYEQRQTTTYPTSKYKTLDSALADKNENAVTQAVKDLQAEGVKRSDIFKRMNPYTAEGESQKPLFHESAALESKFRKSLIPEQMKLYEQAKKDRLEQWKLFRKLWRAG